MSKINAHLYFLYTVEIVIMHIVIMHIVIMHKSENA